jgi:hypothetical protein
MEAMPSCDRAQRYRDRAEQCLQTVSSSQTPGTGEVHLLIAQYCLLLAASEKSKTSSANDNHH